VNASKATRKVADINAKRQGDLGGKGISSERTRELAELEALKTKADLERTEALTSLARSDVRALEADVGKVQADTAAALQDANAAAALADVEIANAQAELFRIETRMARQESMVIKAPIAGTVLRLLAAQGGEMVKQGDALAVLVPGAGQRAVELWVDGRDIPLVDVDTEVRLQFEGWPAVQFSGWPGLAVGTFVGRVALVDAMDDGHGRFRVVVLPAAGTRWPETKRLRQGVRAHAWFTLGEVRLGYELWRQFNGFPPAIPPVSDAHGQSPGAAHTGAGAGKTGKADKADKADKAGAK
jgi:biotin carboxyl carrier protein